MSELLGFNGGTTPWDIGRPQKAFVDLEEAGEIQGSVLDIGCGTGENAMHMARKGYRTVGVDSSPTSIAKAMLKTTQRNLPVKFIIFEPLQLEHLGMIFDTIIDSGLFHLYDDSTRPLYVKSLGRVLKPEGYLHILCISEGNFGSFGPKRVTKGDFRFYFIEGWEVKAIRGARFEVNYGRGWNWAWLATIQRR